MKRAEPNHFKKEVEASLCLRKVERCSEQKEIVCIYFKLNKC